MQQSYKFIRLSSNLCTNSSLDLFRYKFTIRWSWKLVVTFQDDPKLINFHIPCKFTIRFSRRSSRSSFSFSSLLFLLYLPYFYLGIRRFQRNVHRSGAFARDACRRFYILAQLYHTDHLVESIMLVSEMREIEWREREREERGEGPQQGKQEGRKQRGKERQRSLT